MSSHRKITPPERDTSAADAGGSSDASESPAGETPDAAAPETSASPPVSPIAPEPPVNLAAAALRMVRYTTHGASYDLALSSNGDLLYPETGAIAVTGAKQWTEGDPVEGCWVPLN